MIHAEAVELVPGVKNERLFHAANEFARASEVIRRYLHPHAVLHWIRHQAEGFLAEFGFGESLSIQPSYWLEIHTTSGVPEVFPLNIPEYGEQSVSYLEAPDFPPDIGQGLGRAYRMLSDAETGEGVIIVSPTDFYKDFGSRFDVINLFRVVENDGLGIRMVEGRYLLLDGALADHERAFLLNWHNPKANVPADASPDLIVRSPQRFQFGSQELGATDPIVAHAEELERIFSERFGKALLGGESDLGLYELVRSLVDSGVEDLMRAVLDKDAQRLLTTLRTMMVTSQRSWASERGIDPDEHLLDIFSGRRPIGGIHPLTGLPVEETSGVGLDSGEPCESEGLRRCVIHGEYEGESCPQCRRRES